MWLLDRYRRWKLARENYVIAKAMLLGADIHPFLSNNDVHYAVRENRLPSVYYRAFAPVHGGTADVTVYGKSVYACAKAYLKMQELV